VTATPRSGEGHDVGPDGCDPRHAVDRETAVDHGTAVDNGTAEPGVAGADPGNSTGVLLRTTALSRRSRRITVALVVAFAYVLVDIFVEGPLTTLDEKFLAWHSGETVKGLHSWAWGYDKMGQRSVLLPILLILAGALARRHRTWRPLVLSFAAFVILNVVVGALKILIGRTETETGDPSVLNHGIIFPSGHSSNMVLTGGMMAYLLVRYVDRPPVRRFVAGWSVLTTLTIATSLYLGTHWVSDLLGGVLIGGLLLQAVIVFDRKTAHVRDDPPAIVAAAIRLIEPADDPEPDAAPPDETVTPRVIGQPVPPPQAGAPEQPPGRSGQPGPQVIRSASTR
jgi:membrane-associated phospholipid phosphatase